MTPRKHEPPAPADQPAAVPPRARGGAAIDRRGFLSATTLAALGVAASYSLLDPAGALAALSELVAPSWKPLTSLSTVSLAADSKVKRYPRLAHGSAFDTSRAVKLLENALAGLSGGSAVEAIQAGVPVGGTVLIKPNWVEPWRWSKGKITHPTLVLAAARIAAEAVGPTGHVFIGEGTSEGRDLPKILSETGFTKALKTFGLTEATSTRARVRIVDLNASSAGSVVVRLRGRSRFASVGSTVYDASGRAMGHIGEGHLNAYRISRPVIDADLVINFAKAKVHTSAGVTLAMKNLLGIVPTGHDRSGRHRLKTVPHFSATDAHEGTKHVLNRTIGRTSADLTACALYAAHDGSVKSTRQRNMLCIIDGVISGERYQFSPRPVPTGWVAASYDPVAVDHVAARCMGFDPARVRSLKSAASGPLRLGTAKVGNVRIVYHGSSSFGRYFSAKRALEPESVVAHWGKAISLKKWTIKAPSIRLSGSHVAIKPSGSGLVVRLYSGSEYVNLKRASNGTYSADLPAEPTGPVRLAVMDAHFNVWDGLVRA